ncbi:ATP-binding protein [Maledivibacter halophilus]|uniref:4Fe-4S binding domain-containing protein n=1 Tax=Maledivibacter halophilus TaxID=36842 RepID=A0A1T5IA90_9FIRM|nr:4Fe-4S binding protein [Maledivibacter halophilus]SKC36069.1 4Fe-4S binding domain-containing protein [Maledivibacter halophilus]
MKRNIISINEEKCVGCGLCVNACHQGALKLIDGKAKLISESYCDGLGMCLPKCPTGALRVIEKDVEEFDNSKRNEESKIKGKDRLACGCPSTHSKELKRNTTETDNKQSLEIQSELRQWPCQIKLVPTNAPYFKGARLLIAADCTAFANANIHSKFMKNRITLIGCPKLDSVDYSEKLTEIIKNNDIKSVDVLRMSVPCCGGIENAVKQALINSGKMIPWRVIVVSTNGDIIE